MYDIGVPDIRCIMRSTGPVRIQLRFPWGAAAVVSSFWVAICAAAPEIIWQGARIAAHHVSRADLLSALLLGLVLAFFVEPVLEALRQLISLRGRGVHAHAARQNPLFVAAIAFIFALATVCVHDAITSFVSNHYAGSVAEEAGFEAALNLAIAWAIVPFAVAIAWFGVGSRWFAIPSGILAALSPCIAGWLFAWTWQDVVTTTIPSLVILGLSYRRMAQQPEAYPFRQCAGVVAGVALVWLVLSALFDQAVAGQLGASRFYDETGIWVDARFYAGWAIGLLIAPSPTAPG